MKKGKKFLAMSLALAMCMTSLTACGKNGGSGDAPAATQAGSEAVTVKKPELMKVEAPTVANKKSDAKKVKLTVWCPSEEMNIMKELCEAFNQTLEDYDVSFEYAEKSESQASTALSQDAKNSADVFMFSGDQLSGLVEQRLVFGLDVMTSDYPDLLTQYEESAIEACKRDGKLYALPFTPNQFFLYYNNSMLTEEDVKSLESIMAKDLGAEVKNYATGVADAWYLASYFYAGGCTLFGKKGDDASQCNWNSPEGKNVVKYLNNLMASGKLHNNSGTDDSLGLMESGKLASWTMGSWKSNAIKEVLKDKYAVTVMPTVTYEGREAANITPFADYKAVAVNSASNEGKVAAMLACFLTDDYAQAMRLESRAFAPTIKALMDQVANADDTMKSKLDPAVIAATIQSDADHSVPRPVISQIEKYWNPGAALGNYIYTKDSKVTDDAQLDKTMDTFAGAVTKKDAKKEDKK